MPGLMANRGHNKNRSQYFGSQGFEEEIWEQLAGQFIEDGIM